MNDETEYNNTDLDELVDDTFHELVTTREGINLTMEWNELYMNDKFREALYWLVQAAFEGESPKYVTDFVDVVTDEAYRIALKRHNVELEL